MRLWTWLSTLDYRILYSSSAANGLGVPILASGRVTVSQAAAANTLAAVLATIIGRSKAVLGVVFIVSAIEFSIVS